MTTAGWFQFFALVAVIGVTAPLLGRYMAAVYGDDTRAPGDRLFGPVERLVYRLCRVNPAQEQRWTAYAYSLLGFSLVSFLFLYGLQRLQGSLPLNPTDMPAVGEHLSFNTAVSFMTNTNWQSYGGETTMSFLTQMMGLGVQNFVSAAAGMAVMAALIRGLARRRASTIGNFWVDLTRSTIRILLPLSLVVAVALVSQGVVQNFGGFTEVETLEGTTQSIPGGPAASQIAIKQLGTNGGGFFNTNSAHPFENPTGFSGFVELWAILVIPFGLAFTFGHMVRDRRQGRAVFAIMFVVWAVMSLGAMAMETGGNPELDVAGVDQSVSSDEIGGNLEGKEVRFGPTASGLWAASTTGTSNGSVNSMHDSYTPLGGGIAMGHMMLGEVSPGGVGVGLNGLLIMAILAVFIAGLMVGRTPEYLGKKIQAAEMKMVVLYVLAMPLVLLGFAAASVLLDSALSSRANPGPHGLSEILYAFTSAGNNNGSAFAGLTTNTQWYDTTMGLAMLVGRFFLIIPVLGIAGSMARKQVPPRDGRDVPDPHPALRRPGRRGRGDRRRAHLLPSPGAGTDRGAAEPVSTPTREPVVRPVGSSARDRHPLPQRSMVDPAIVRSALVESIRKLDPRIQARNPVMFVVLVGSVLTTYLFLRDIWSSTAKENVFAGLVALFLWFTVLFANFAEAMAEGRGKAQAATLRKTRAETVANRRRADGTIEQVPSSALEVGDECVVSAGEVIPSDGDVIEGIASVDESAITGESAPVIRESGGDRSAVTGGTKVLSDQIVVRITARPGETFLDRMIALVEGAERQKTPNEIALNILLSGLTIIFLLAVVTLQPFAIYSDAEQKIIVLVALLVCLIPTTIGALLSAIGIAGMDRMVQRNVLAMSGRAVEAAGDVNTLLLDKTGTITLGNRQAADFLPVPGVLDHELATAAHRSSLADETPEGRSIVTLAEQRYGLDGSDRLPDAELVPFTAQTRMSGIDLDGFSIRKGATDAVKHWVEEHGGEVPEAMDTISHGIATDGGTPLVVAEHDTRSGMSRVLGVIHLKDVVKDGMVDRFAQLRAMGIRTVMITGDNPLTAKAIATEAGVDDFLAEATPEDKMALIRKEQAGGRLVAMTGDGTNDAPALAQADVGVAMNTGTQAAKEAGNMVDLDSDPTKLIEIVEIGKQLLITRGALTTFSIANDVAKYFAIIPAMFMGVFPALDDLNIMGLDSPRSAILAAVIFNALVIVVLIPLALRGVRFRAEDAVTMLRRNLLLYGLGGLIVPFVGIKLVDLVISTLGVS